MMEQELRERDPAQSAATRPEALIVSDVLLYRQGLRASLERDERIVVLDAVASDDMARALAARTPDVVLLDAGAAHILDQCRQLRREQPTLRLVAFGITGGTRGMVDCAEAGVMAFVDCDGSIGDLVQAVNAALRGELSLSPEVGALFCSRLADLAVGQQPADQLTRREREIALLVAEGLSNKEIAKDLRIGPSTVKNHVHNILDKLRVRRRSGVAQQLRASLAPAPIESPVH